MNRTRTTRGAVRDDYLELILEFPLRDIRTERENQAALAMMTRLMMRDEAKLTPGQRDYMGALGALIERFESKAYPLGPDERPPHERLAALMERVGMTRGELAALLGVHQPMTSLLLNGKRQLTRENILKLAERFKLNPGYFL